jgi:hypothetical protein
LHVTAFLGRSSLEKLASLTVVRNQLYVRFQLGKCKLVLLFLEACDDGIFATHVFCMESFLESFFERFEK